jgi:hypothetical protein
MKHPSTPQEKKQASYRRDHYTLTGENDKSRRKKRPLKKAKNTRAARKNFNQLLPRVLTLEEKESKEGQKLYSLRTRKVTNWGVMRLDEIVARRRLNRRKKKNEPNQSLQPTAPSRRG